MQHSNTCPIQRAGELGIMKKMIKVDKKELPGTLLFFVLIGAVVLMTGLTDRQLKTGSEKPFQVEVVVKNEPAENETLLVQVDLESETQVQ